MLRCHSLSQHPPPSQLVAKIARAMKMRPPIRRLAVWSMGPKTWEGTHAPGHCLDCRRLAACARRMRQRRQGRPGPAGVEGRARRQWNGRSSRPSWAQGRHRAGGSARAQGRDRRGRTTRASRTQRRGRTSGSARAQGRDRGGRAARPSRTQGRCGSGRSAGTPGRDRRGRTARTERRSGSARRHWTSRAEGRRRAPRARGRARRERRSRGRGSAGTSGTEGRCGTDRVSGAARSQERPGSARTCGTAGTSRASRRSRCRARRSPQSRGRTGEGRLQLRRDHDWRLLHGRQRGPTHGRNDGRCVPRRQRNGGRELRDQIEPLRSGSWGAGRPRSARTPQNAEGSDDGSDGRPPDNGRGGLQLGEDEGNSANTRSFPDES